MNSFTHRFAISRETCISISIISLSLAVLTLGMLLNPPRGAAAELTVSYGPKTDFATDSGPYAIAHADFNGDGRLDLAVANNSSNTVSILLGTEGGNFVLSNNFDVGNSPTSVAVGDFNG